MDLSPETVQAISAIAQVILALAALIVSVAVTLFVYRGTRQAADAQYWQSIREAWVAIDEIALASEENLRMADSLFRPELADQPIEHSRKRWFAYLVLNNFVAMCYGTDIPHSAPKRGNLESLRIEPRPLMRDEVFCQLTQSGIYHRGFTDMWRELRREQGLPPTA